MTTEAGPLDGFERVARAEDVPQGELLGVACGNGELVCLANVSGEMVAMEDRCSHQDFPMSAGTIMPDGTIQCSWHGGRFDCRTGHATALPATEPLTMFEVRVADGEVWVGPRKAPG